MPLSTSLPRKRAHDQCMFETSKVMLQEADTSGEVLESGNRSLKRFCLELWLEASHEITGRSHATHAGCSLRGTSTRWIPRTTDLYKIGPSSTRLLQLSWRTSVLSQKRCSCFGVSGKRACELERCPPKLRGRDIITTLTLNPILTTRNPVTSVTPDPEACTPSP